MTRKARREKDFSRGDTALARAPWRTEAAHTLDWIDRYSEEGRDQ